LIQADTLLELSNGQLCFWYSGRSSGAQQWPALYLVQVDALLELSNSQMYLVQADAFLKLSNSQMYLIQADAFLKLSNSGYKRTLVWSSAIARCTWYKRTLFWSSAFARLAWLSAESSSLMSSSSFLRMRIASAFDLLSVSMAHCICSITWPENHDDIFAKYSLLFRGISVLIYPINLFLVQSDNLMRISILKIVRNFIKFSLK
jgi:hypothetical protein